MGLNEIAVRVSMTGLDRFETRFPGEDRAGLRTCLLLVLAHPIPVC